VAARKAAGQDVEIIALKEEVAAAATEQDTKMAALEAKVAEMQALAAPSATLRPYLAHTRALRTPFAAPSVLTAPPRTFAVFRLEYSLNSVKQPPHTYPFAFFHLMHTLCKLHALRIYAIFAHTTCCVLRTGASCAGVV